MMQKNRQAKGSAASENDPLMEALERQRDLTAIQKEIAEHAAAARKALAGDGKGREGKVELAEQGGHFAELLSHRALAAAAAGVAERVEATGTSRKEIVLTHDWAVAERVQLWHLVDARMDAFEDELDRLLGGLARAQIGEPRPPGRSLAGIAPLLAVGPALAAAGGLLGAAAQVASFLRSDLGITGRSVDIPDEALLATVAEELREAGWEVVLPDLTVREEGSLVSKLRALLEKRSELVARRDERHRDLQERLEELERLRRRRTLEEGLFNSLVPLVSEPAMMDKLEEVRGQLRRLEDEIAAGAAIERRWTRTLAEIDSLLAALDAFITGLQSGDEGAPAPLTTLRSVEALGLEDSTRDLLSVKLTSQGGEVHVRNGPFRTRLGFLGGASIAFVHMDADGKILAAGDLPASEARHCKISDLETLAV